MVTCTTVDGCTANAVEQALVDCAGCEAMTGALAERLDAKAKQLASQQAVVDGIRVQCEREDNRAPTEAESLVLHLVHDEVSTLGEDLEKLRAASELLSGEHTHPVFACTEHVALLGS